MKGRRRQGRTRVIDGLSGFLSRLRGTTTNEAKGCPAGNPEEGDGGRAKKRQKTTNTPPELEPAKPKEAPTPPKPKKAPTPPKPKKTPTPTKPADAGAGGALSTPPAKTKGPSLSIGSSPDAVVVIDISDDTLPAPVAPPKSEPKVKIEEPIPEPPKPASVPKLESGSPNPLPSRP